MAQTVQVIGPFTLPNEPEEDKDEADYRLAVDHRFTNHERRFIFLESQIANVNAGTDNSIQKVTKLILWNADTNTAIRELVRNSTIDLNVDKSSLNIKAVTEAGGVEVNVGSVVFFLDGQVDREEIQNNPPYFAFGDGPNGALPFKFEVGDYQLQAIPYSGASATGIIGASRYINIKVTKPEVPGQVLGCMDPNATNYNPNATAPDPNAPCTYNPPSTYERQTALISAQTSLDSGVLGAPYKTEVFTAHGMVVSSLRSRFPGGKSLRFEGRKADKDASNVVRSEIKINETSRLNRRMIYGYSFFLPVNGDPDGDFVDDSNWCICFQLHAFDTAPYYRQPPVCFNFQGGRMYLDVKWNDQTNSTTYKGQRRIDMGPFMRGRWVDVVMDYYAGYGSDGRIDIYFSMVNSQGTLELVQKVKDRGPNMYNDSIMSPYPKWGWYKYGWTTQSKLVIFYDEFRQAKGATANIKDVMPDTNLNIVYLP